MADLAHLEEIVWQCRENILRSFHDHPEVSAVGAYDAVTHLLTAIVEELQGIRQSLDARSNPNA